MANKIGNSSYQFKWKGNEHPYNFNSTIEEMICSAKEELGKLKPMAPGEKDTLKRAEEKQQEKYQRPCWTAKTHKGGGPVEFGWTTINYYQDGPLALDLQDEKSLNCSK